MHLLANSKYGHCSCHAVDDNDDHAAGDPVCYRFVTKDDSSASALSDKFHQKPT